jgi:SpoVK/Ycf46/Vps4 family AAA+-type ATPase
VCPISPSLTRLLQEILEYYLGSKPVAEVVSAAVLARKTPGFSGAQLANMVNEAALAAAKAGANSIDNALLDEARDKVMMGRERTLTRTSVRAPSSCACSADACAVVECDANIFWPVLVSSKVAYSSALASIVTWSCAGHRHLKCTARRPEVRFAGCRRRC